ncbi:MAG: response regulator [Limnospira sp.]
MKVLLVEDDDSLAEIVAEALTSQHYLVDRAPEGQTGWELAEAFTYDLILLDVLLPKLNGLEFCQKRRQQGDRTPILLMTVQGASTTKVRGLDAGADDYLVKPFDLNELLARIRALLRRSQDSLPPAFEWGDVRLDPSNCQVTCRGKELKLTAKEYSLLELFLRNPQRIFNPSALLDHLWSFEDPPSENAVRAQIKSLRQKLKQNGVTDAIETIYGLGYRLKALEHKTDPRTEQRQKPDNSHRDQNPIPQTRITQIWEKQRSKYRARLTVIEKAIAALTAGNLPSEMRQPALREAHTLAGSLGSFGLARASALSREIEQLLQQSDVTGCTLSRLSTLALDLAQEIDTTPTFQTPKTSPPPPPPPENATRLLIVDDDTGLAQALAAEATARGMEAAIAHDIDKAREILRHTPRDLVLLDLSFPESTEAGFELLAELNRTPQPIPAIVFTGKESFADRVKVARLGGLGFLQKPISPDRVLAAITQVLHQSQPPIARVLIVDDDPKILDELRTLLEPWGIKSILLDDPQQFWTILEQSNPDLLIVDEQMPEVSGIELCQVVRNDPKWNELPVLILSTHRDAETITQMFLAGADDYIPKPLVEPELIARLFNRLDRSQLHRKIAAHQYRNSPPSCQNFNIESAGDRTLQNPLPSSQLDRREAGTYGIVPWQGSWEVRSRGD